MLVPVMTPAAASAWAEGERPHLCNCKGEVLGAMLPSLAGKAWPSCMGAQAGSCVNLSGI